MGEKNITVKRERRNNQYYWVLRDKGKIIDKVQYKQKDTKANILKEAKKRGLISKNLLYREESKNFIKTVTRERPRHTKLTQYKAEYEVFIDGKKVNNSKLEPFRGISPMGLSDSAGKRLAKQKGWGFAKQRLMAHGVMEYEQNLEIREVRHSYITRKAKKPTAPRVKR